MFDAADTFQCEMDLVLEAEDCRAHLVRGARDAVSLVGLLVLLRRQIELISLMY